MTTFTIAEDIKTLLTNNFGANSLDNGGFETGLAAPWTPTDNLAIVGSSFPNTGDFAGLLTGTTVYFEQTVRVKVDKISELSFFMNFNNGGYSETITFEVTYSDSTTYSDATAHTDTGNYNKYTYTGNLTAGKTITKIKFASTGLTEVLFDDIVLTHDSDFDESTLPSIRLLDDDNPDSYPDNGEIIIKDEQLLRIDPFNGIRTETFLVDIDVIYDDPSANAPTTLKLLLAEIDRVFDTETFALTTYIYKSRYNWLASYRIGVVKYQVEVANALVTRPALA